MSYDDWINRERRIRTKILKDSPMIRQTGIYRVCGKCGEVCLCHEMNCPNCYCAIINEEGIIDLDKEVECRIRCLFRFQHLSLEGYKAED